MPAVTIRRTIRVHATERSTDQDLLQPYIGAIVAIIAVIAIAAIAWIAMAPSPAADLPAMSDAPPTAPPPAPPVAPLRESLD